MVLKKGSRLHVRIGKVFAVSIIASCLIILPIACMPNHESLFLFLISLFTIYLVLIGRRALTFKSRLKVKAEPMDFIITILMVIFSVGMFLYGTYGFFAPVSDNLLYFIFGGLGLFLSIKNFIFYRNFKDVKSSWLTTHLTHMIAALIASITAFIVAGLKLWTVSAWVLPSVIGTLLIIYWRLKVKGKLSKTR